MIMISYFLIKHIIINQLLIPLLKDWHHSWKDWSTVDDECCVLLVVLSWIFGHSTNQRRIPTITLRIQQIIIHYLHLVTLSYLYYLLNVKIYLWNSRIFLLIILYLLWIYLLGLMLIVIPCAILSCFGSNLPSAQPKCWD